MTKRQRQRESRFCGRCGCEFIQYVKNPMTIGYEYFCICKRCGNTGPSRKSQQDAYASWNEKQHG